MNESKNFYLQLGDNIKRLREEKLCATQEIFAQRVGISRPSVANIEKGRQQISAWQLVSFSHALGVTVEDIIPAEAKHEKSTLSESLPESAQPYKEWIEKLQGI